MKSAKRKPKPLKVSVGAVSVPIYRIGDDRWCITYRPAAGAGRVRVTRVTLEAAKEKAREICIDIMQGQVAAGRLTSDHLLQAAAALPLLPDGVTLDGIAREAQAAVATTGGASIAEMARFWAKHHAHSANQAPPLPEIHTRMLHDLARQDLSPRWRQALTKDLRKFVDAFAARPIGEIHADDIQEWLGKQPGNWRTANNRLALIRQLFHFARKKGFVAQDRATEPDKVDPLKRPRGEHSRPGVLSASELADVLAGVGPKWLPFVVLGAFGGFRRAEIERMDWSDIRWEEQIIHVRQEVAKSTRRVAGDERFPPMRPQLLAWLEPWRNHAAGPVCTLKRWEDELARLRKPCIADDPDDPESKRPAIRGKWPKNALRHTYGSCRTTETKNMPQVADEMGNSVAEVRRDYRNPRTEREVAAWAAIYPPGYKLDNVISLAQAK